MEETYADLILKAAITSKVSPYHLASRIKQEVGPFLSHSSISGTVEGYKGLYNFYNIGATSSAEPMGAIINGLKYARDGKGASQETKNKYLIPWDNKEKAITGGGIFIGSSYINVGQNTVYFQKFHVTDTKGEELFWHQYMTNVLAPYSESKSIYQGYKNNGLIDSPMHFIIPIYNNMPEIATSNPNILESDYQTDNTTVYSNGSKVNIRTGPSTSYEVITQVNQWDKMTRIGKGIQNGEKWDKVKLENGIIGYIFQNYVTETAPIMPIEQIHLKIDNPIIPKGEKAKIEIEILPVEAKDNKIQWSSSDSSIVMVDNLGNITALRAGTAVITAKAEGSDVKGTISIQVTSKVTGIELEESEIYLSVGETYSLNAKVQPEDADNPNILYKVENEDVLTINENGIITALIEGNSKIQVISEENNNIQTECHVIVTRNLGENEIIFQEPLKHQGIYITGIPDNNNTVSEIKKNIITNLEIEMVNSKNETLSNEDKVGTNCKLQIKENENLLKSYEFILYGDVNGDGRINSVDLLVLQRHILEIEFLEPIYQKAGNINKNGKKPTSVDLLLIQRHILGLKSIEQ